MASKALPPIPYIALLQRLKPQRTVGTEDYKKAMVLWPKEVRKIEAGDMTGCTEQLGVECSHPQFLGVHFSKIALLFSDIRRLKGVALEGKASCMPLNYHWLNVEMEKILGAELSNPFLISEVITLELLHYKIFINLLKEKTA